MMIRNKRQQQIMNLLNEHEIVNVIELSELLNCSTMTIRRDLEYFEQAGLARRIHGGAVLIKNETNLPHFVERLDKCQLEKEAIGKAALAYIEKDSVVCFDAGTTTMAIIDHIPEDYPLTVISTGINTSSALCRFRNIEVIQVGGFVHHSSFTVCDSLATDFIKKFNSDVAFISTRAINPSKGTFESTMSHVDEKQALASISKKVVVLADHTKFEGMSLIQALSLETIDVVITDHQTSSIAIKQLKDAGVEVVIVQPERG